MRSNRSLTGKAQGSLPPIFKNSEDVENLKSFAIKKPERRKDKFLYKIGDGTFAERGPAFDRGNLNQILLPDFVGKTNK